MTSIPVIDIGPALSGEDIDGVVAQLRAAITEVGFLQVVGHGFPRELLDAAYASMEDLEAGPEERRAELRRPRELSRGLFERFDEAGRLERMSMQFVPYDTPEEADAVGATRGHPDYFAPNAWPADDPGFRRTWKAYEAASRRLGHALMALFARALDLPPDHFAEMFTHDVTLYSVNWYPPQPPDRVGEHQVVLNRPHADSGVLTVLHQRGDYEGLQVRAGDGSWVTVPVLDEAFILNIGHLMRRATNGTWPATLHRVVSGATPADSRKSIAMHFLPNIDAVIEPLPTTTAEAGARFEPISTYDWQQQFMAQYALPGWQKPLAAAAT